MLDTVFLIIITGTVLRGALKGFVWQFGRILAVVSGCFFARIYSRDMGVLLDGLLWGDCPPLFHLSLYLLTFCGMAAAIALLAEGLLRLWAWFEVGFLDGLLGAALGLAKGGFLSALLLVALLSMPGESWGRLVEGSTVAPMILDPIRRVHFLLPGNVSAAGGRAQSGGKRAKSGADGTKSCGRGMPESGRTQSEDDRLPAGEGAHPRLRIGAGF
jgi:hypothetical protein